MSRTFKILIVAIVMMFAATVYTSQVTNAAVFGRPKWRGYFDNKLDQNGQPVWSGGITIGGSGKAAVSSFMSTLRSKYSGSAQNRTGAAFIYNMMMGNTGGGGSRSVSNAQFTLLEERLNNFIDAGGTITYDSSYKYYENTYYQDAHNDIAWYSESETWPAYIFAKGGTQYFVIKRACANPLGNMPGIPELGWSVSSMSSVSLKGGAQAQTVNVKPGQTVTFRHSMTNTGSIDPVKGVLTRVVSTNGVPEWNPAKPEPQSLTKAAGATMILWPSGLDFTIPATAKSGTKYCHTLTYARNAADQKAGNLLGVNGQVCAVVSATTAAWDLEGVSTAVPASVKAGDTATFTHTITNVGKTANTPAAAWYSEWTSPTTSKLDTGTGLTLAGGASKTVVSKGYKIPSTAKTGATYCQDVVFPDSSAKPTVMQHSVPACVTVGGDPPATKEAITMLDAPKPTNVIAPGFSARWNHYLTDDTYKPYKGTTLGGSWYTTGMVEGDVFVRVNVTFRQNGGQADFYYNSPGVKTTTLGSVPNKTPMNYSYYWPTENDIGNSNICGYFDYTITYRTYTIKSEQKVHHYDAKIGSYTTCDSDGNCSTSYYTYYVPVYWPWYWVDTGTEKTTGVMGTSNTDKCIDVGTKPKVQVRGGDLAAGGQVDTSIMYPYYRGPISGNTMTFASWVEYSIIAGGNRVGGVYAGMASASMAAGGVNVPGVYSGGVTGTTWNKLIFRNTTSPPGNFQPQPTSKLAQTLNGMQPSTTPFSGLGSASGVYKVGDITLGGNVDAGKTLIILSSGTVRINGDIRIPANYANIGDIPQVIIAAKNILIAPNVANIDAWLVADDAGGVINTCDGYDMSNVTLGTCNTQLRVNGYVASDILKLYRTFGSRAGSSGEPAEIFNARGDAAIWSRTYSSRSDKVQTKTVTEVSPRF